MNENELKHYHKTRDHEAAGVQGLVRNAISTLGVPGLWAEVLAVAAPVAVAAGTGLVKALHPDSPGGSKITRGELRRIARSAAADLEDALIREFEHLVVDDGDEPAVKPARTRKAEPTTPPSDDPPKAA